MFHIFGSYMETPMVLQYIKYYWQLFMQKLFSYKSLLSVTLGVQTIWFFVGIKGKLSNNTLVQFVDFCDKLITLRANITEK